MRRLRGFGRSAGQSPGLIDPVSMAEEVETSIRIHSFSTETATTSEPADLDELQNCISGSDIYWIRIMGFRNVLLIQEVCKEFQLHALLVEDIFNRFQRPKLEIEGVNILTSLNAIQTENEDTNQARNVVHVSVLLSGSTVITFEEREVELLGKIEQRIVNCQGRIRRSGSDYLFYAVLDLIVDGYFLVLENVSDRIEELEFKLTADPEPEVLEGIHRLRTRMLLFRKSVWPLREVVNQLSREETDLVRKSTVAYFRDLYDHTVQVIDTTETLRDILSGMVDTYMSGISNRMNKIMQLLTIVATIFIPLTFVAGVYGMNFHHMPELPAKWAYPAVLLLMACVAFGMLLYFRKKRWL